MPPLILLPQHVATLITTTLKMKYYTISLLCILFFGSQSQNKKNENFSFMTFGDMPYNLPQDYPRFENVIKTINEQHPAFTVNVGDFKSSSTPCTEEVFKKMLDYYQQFEKPMIYTPGDNEWTDCTKKEAGAFDAEERLELIRKMFFKDNSSFGKEKLALISQSQNPQFLKFVENKRWEYGNVAFATIHIVGSNNNFLTSSKNGNKEFFERNEANLAWLDEVFKSAKTENNRALVIFTQADMFYNAKDMKEASGFSQIKKKLKELAIDFKKPVLLVNGDSHVFLIDKPFLVDEKKEKSLDNFTRLQVPGESNMHATKINVIGDSPSVFQFEEVFVPGN